MHGTGRKGPQMDMDDNKRRRSMLIYVLIAIVVYLAVSQTLYPNLVSSQVTETSYSQFLEDVDNNKVVSAEIDTSNNEI